MNRAELSLSPRLSSMLSAYRHGMSDAKKVIAPLYKARGAHDGSAWAEWYMQGFQRQPLMTELTERGIAA